MAELHTDDTFMWENKLMGCPEEDYDRVPREERGVVDPLVNRITHQRGPKVSASLDFNKPLSQQIGGEHYRQGDIQPIEYIHANDMDFFSGNVVKYITRWKYKSGLEDLKKAKHYIELLMEQEYGYHG
jgi:hypothetical protein